MKDLVAKRKRDEDKSGVLTARENPLGGELEGGISCLDVSDISSKSPKNEKGHVMSTSPGLPNT